MAEKQKTPKKPKAKSTPNRDKTKACAATEIAAPRPRGRPTVYTDAIADEICQRLADGESLRSICKVQGMPKIATVLGWSLDPGHPFSEQYRRARDIGWRLLAEEILEISDNGGIDANNRRLRVDSRKWLLSKMLPKLYGDKITSEVVGQDGGPVSITVAFYCAL
jgi:hypothetical protein